MQESTEWRTEADLLRLVADKVGESLNLDYKSSGALSGSRDRIASDLSKDVAAFANSDGGAIVFGVVEEGHLPDHLDEGVDPAERPREWLEEVIHSNIRQRVDKLHINQIPLDSTSPGRVAYVVTVPASDSAPHMSRDHRYYKRHNFQSVPMEDYEVRDVSNRSRGPRLSIDIFPSRATTSGVELIVTIKNSSAVPADYYILGLLLDERISAQILDQSFAHNGSRLLLNESGMIPIPGGGVVSAQDLSHNFAIPNHMPVWEGTNMRICRISIPYAPSLEGTYYLGWSISTPRAELARGLFEMEVADFKVTIGQATVHIPPPETS